MLRYDPKSLPRPPTKASTGRFAGSELLKNLVHQGEKALLLVTHNIAEACDWIHEMKDGRIVASHPRGTRRSIF